MKFTLSCLAAFAATVSSSKVDLMKRESPLSVKLTSMSDTMVKASISNTGADSYNLFYKGSLLDTDAPVDKFYVTSKAAPAKFTGYKLRMMTSDLSEDSFKPIMAGETIDVEVELASIYELSSSGKYDVLTSGAIPYAAINSTELSGAAVPYSSNILSIDVDSAKTATVEKAVDVIAKRTVVQSDCTGTRRTAVLNALSNCQSLASAAATAATSGSATTFQRYFKTTSSTTRSTVAARLRAVASDCGSSTSGRTTTYCTDVYGACSSNVLAYTLPSANVIAYCPIFYTYLPAVSGTCHAQDQATTVLHEETHAPAVYSPGTQDLGYGYSAASALSATNALNNADTYALYANAVYVGGSC